MCLFISINYSLSMRNEPRGIDKRRCKHIMYETGGGIRPWEQISRCQDVIVVSAGQPAEGILQKQINISRKGENMHEISSISQSISTRLLAAEPQAASVINLHFQVNSSPD